MLIVLKDPIDRLIAINPADVSWVESKPLPRDGTIITMRRGAKIEVSERFGVVVDLLNGVPRA